MEPPYAKASGGTLRSCEASIPSLGRSCQNFLLKGGLPPEAPQERRVADREGFEPSNGY